MRYIFMFIVALAALNIISGLVMLVKNKGRDIAILRTIGAGRGAIPHFFMAGAAIGLAGAAFGLAFACCSASIFEAIQPLVEWADNYSTSIRHTFAHAQPKQLHSEVALRHHLSTHHHRLTSSSKASRLQPFKALQSVDHFSRYTDYNAHPTTRLAPTSTARSTRGSHLRLTRRRRLGPFAPPQARPQQPSQRPVVNKRLQTSGAPAPPWPPGTRRWLLSSLVQHLAHLAASISSRLVPRGRAPIFTPASPC